MTGGEGLTRTVEFRALVIATLMNLNVNHLGIREPKLATKIRNK